eukprot:365340-Chlamydomonas_euryale.AAC.7
MGRASVEESYQPKQPVQLSTFAGRHSSVWPAPAAQRSAARPYQPALPVAAPAPAADARLPFLQQGGRVESTPGPLNLGRNTESSEESQSCQGAWVQLACARHRPRPHSARPALQALGRVDRPSGRGAQRPHPRW